MFCGKKLIKNNSNENVNSYKTKRFYTRIVYYEEEYPNILFAKDAEIYDFDGNNVLVIGGTYSVDKEYRLMMGYNWYPSAHPSKEAKNMVKVDKSTKEFLDEIENITDYKKWYYGHYHPDKTIDKPRFMMNDMNEFKLTIDKR